jgi:hypothetical protein
VLDLNTNIKVNEARGKEKPTGKQIVARFKFGKTLVYDVLKAKQEIRRQWLDSSKGSMEWKAIQQLGFMGVVC